MYKSAENSVVGCGLFGVSLYSDGLVVDKPGFCAQESGGFTLVSEQAAFSNQSVISGFYTFYTGLISKITLFKKDTL